MKKALLITGIIATIGLSSVSKTNAAVGAALYLHNKHKVTAIVGGSIAASGLATMGAAYSGAITVGLAFVSWAAIATGVGLVVLDDERIMEYAPITDIKLAEELGLTEKEIESYNDNIDSFNVALADISSEEELSQDEYEVLWRDAYNALEIPHDARTGFAKVNNVLLSK